MLRFIIFYSQSCMQSKMPHPPQNTKNTSNRNRIIYSFLSSFSAWEGDSHIKRTGVLVVPFRGWKSRFWYLLRCWASKVHCGSFCITFQGIDLSELSHHSRKCVVLELVPTRGEKKFQAMPSNMILAPPSFIKFSSSAFRVFMMTITNKNEKQNDWGKHLSLSDTN